MCQMKVDKKWHEMLSHVKACYRWNFAKRIRRIVIGYVTLGDWKRERSESENWSSVRASNEGLKKTDDSRNMTLFIFVVHVTKRDRCTNNGTIKKNLYAKNWMECNLTASTDWIDGQKKYVVRQLNTCVGDLLANLESFLKYTEQLHSLTQNAGIWHEQLSDMTKLA